MKSAQTKVNVLTSLSKVGARQVAKVITVFLATMVMGGGLLSASTISFLHTTASGTVPFTDGFTLQEFDTNLGTLTGITISLSVTGTAEIDIINTLAVPESFTNAVSSDALTLTGPLATTINTVLSSTLAAGVANPGLNTFPGVPGSASNSANIAPANFGAYEGAGTFFANFSLVFGNGTYSGTSVPGVFFGGSTVAGGTTTITYTYDAADTGGGTAPEPLTSVMIGFGILGLGILTRRKRA